MQQVDHFTGGGCDVHRTVRTGKVFDVATQKDEPVFVGCAHVLTRELRLELAAETFQAIIRGRRTGPDGFVKKLTAPRPFSK
jgi:hypothetical protein